MKHPLARLAATLALCLGLLAMLTASGGCEAIVNGDVPSFGCAPDLGSCPPGKVCSSSGQCIPACPDTPCPDPMVCVARLCVATATPADSGKIADATLDVTPPGADAKSDTQPADVGADRPRVGGAIGASCSVDANCDSVLCADSSILTKPVTDTAGGPVCTKECCRSEDCPASFVCFSPGTGGAYCVKASLLPRGADAGSTLGASSGGSTCTTGNACRSGVCTGGKCADTCCSTADCGGASAACRRTQIDGHQTFACADPGATPLADGQLCSIGSECASNVCYAVDVVSNAYCRPRCCGKASCSNKGLGVSVSCYYLQVMGAPEYLPACLKASENPLGAAAPGAACTRDSTCQTGFCDLASGKCTDVCCIESDCSGYPGASHCRPSTNPHFLTCQP